MVNIKLILLDIPYKKIKLYSPICGYCKIIDISNSGILVQNRGFYSFHDDGRYCIDGECMLFPSKECRDWNEWKSILIPQMIGTVLTAKDHWSWLITKDGLFPLWPEKRLKAEIVNFKDFYWSNKEICIASKSKEIEYFDYLKEIGYTFNKETGIVTKEKWSIFNAKLGDPIFDAECNSIFIFRGIENNKVNKFVSYFIDDCYFYDDINGPYCNVDETGDMRLANQEEIDILIDVLHSKGLNWDPINKEIYRSYRDDAVGYEKPKDSIFLNTDFRPYDRVIVKNFEEGDDWVVDLFSHYDEKTHRFNTTGGCSWTYCLPYNDETKSLIGKDCKYEGKYKTWE